jgi:hypothetical protein
MAKKPVKRERALLILEIGLVGLLCWVVLSSSLATQSNGSVEANNQKVINQTKQKKDKAARKAKRERRERREQKRNERFAPTEGYPEASSVNLIAADATTLACQVFDFAGGATQGFTVEPVFGTPLNLWHGANAVCRAFLTGHSTPYTFYYGQDATCNYNTGARNAANLLSPPISVVGKFAPFSVSFNYLLFVEGGGFDSTFVDISTNNGATWTQFLSKANLINDNQWHNVVANVTALVGSATSVRLRFRFDSVDNIANSTTGWHVDDISVCGQSFDLCLQDDTSHDYLRLNTVTGQYTIKRCIAGPKAVDITGTGTVSTNGNTISFQHFTTDRFISATINTSTHTGSASVKLRQGFSVISFFINDSNTQNNTCSCP